MHNAPNSPKSALNGELSGWEQTLARYVVGDFIDERGLLPGVESGDLVQEVLLCWVERRHGYDLKQGASMQTFFRVIAKNRLVDIYRKQRAEKRGGGKAVLSLDKIVGDDEEENNDVLGDFVEDPQRPDLEVDREIDLDRTLEPLTSRQKELAKGLADGYTLAEMVRKMGVPRTTLKDEFTRIRRVFRHFAT